MAACLHLLVLADYPSYRLPVRWHAQAQTRVDHDLPITVLRLRLRYPVLGLRLLPVPVSHDKPDLG